MDVAVKEPLDADAVREIVVELEARIAARFPERGLRQVAADLAVLIDAVETGANSTQGRVRMARIASRVVMVLILAGTLVALGLGFKDAIVDPNGEITNSLDVLPLIETTINDVVFAGIAVFFLYSFPERVQRGRLLNLLHQLRSTAHIIDMHQLTKDPEQLQAVVRPDRGQQAARAEPRRDGALPRLLLRAPGPGRQDRRTVRRGVAGRRRPRHGQHRRDADVGISRKIWQKISNLPSSADAVPPRGGSAQSVEYPELRPPRG